MHSDYPVYIISGLGADHRVFVPLNLPANWIHLKWIPEKQKESLRNYAERMAINIEENSIIIGLSFGGILACEISNIKKLKHVVLLSTVSSSTDIPFYYKWMGKLQLQHFMPKFMLNRSSVLLEWLFGLDSKEERALLRDIMHGNKSAHFRWALTRIAGWDGKINCSYTHFHGKSDKLFPERFLNSDHLSMAGGHFMLYSHANQLRIKLKQLFATL